MAGDMKKPRVSEIAKLAGVSTATVSKVINGREGVSSSTRARIEKIMEESGYSKSLVTTKTSQTIELVLTEVMANGINAMIAETTEYVKSMPIGITITQTGRGKRSEESFREILNRNPLGVILLLSNATEREKTLLRSRNIPFVIIDSIGEGSQDTLGVGIDNWTGGLIATEHLIKLGHQRIGIITGPQNAESAQARYSGYATALRRAGIQAGSRAGRLRRLHAGTRLRVRMPTARPARRQTADCDLRMQRRHGAQRVPRCPPTRLVPAR